MQSVGAARALQSVDPTRESLKPVRSADHLVLLAERYRWWIFTAIALIYAAGFNGQWRIEPDSALYLSIARNLATGLGYTYHGTTSHIAYPGLPWLEAAAFRMFGIGVLWPIHLLMLGSALGASALTYYLFRLHTQRGVAVVITAMVAFNHGFYQYAFQLRNDMPFLLGVLGVLAGYEGILHRYLPGIDPLQRTHGKWRLAGHLLLLAGGLLLAMTMRPMMLPLIGILALVCCWRLWKLPATTRRWGLVIIIPALLILAGMFLYADPRGKGFRLGGYEQSMAGTFLDPARFLQTLHQTWTVFIPQIVRSVPTVCFAIELGPGVNIIVAILLIGLGIRLWRHRPLWGMWVTATVMVLLFTLPRDRYFLPILPLLAYAWWEWIAMLNRRLGLKWGNLVFCALMTLWVGPNVGRLVGAIINQRQQPFMAYYKQGKLDGIQAFAQRIPAMVPHQSIILAPEGMGRILTYLSGREILDLWEWSPDADTDRPLYIVQPSEGDDPLLPQLQSAGLSVGQTLLSIPRRPQDAPWTLHEVTRLKSQATPPPALESGSLGGRISGVASPSSAPPADN